MRTSYKIVIVGSGAAGLMAAIQASQTEGCALVTDGPLGHSNSVMAQGGLQLPEATPESEERFYEDILRSARGEADPRLVRNFVRQVSPTVAALERWGLTLDRDERGQIIRRLAGGLSEPRIVSVRDQIGPAIMKVLLHKVRSCDLELLEHRRVVRLEQVRGGCFRLRLRTPEDVEEEVEAKAVVVCTGGISYREALKRRTHTTNPPNGNHVLFDHLEAMGLPMVHRDYFQYQPFGIVRTAVNGVGKAVPESIVNFPVRLLDRYGREIGEVRQDRYALTQLMFALAREGRTAEDSEGSRGFWLTLADIDPEDVARTFPKLHQYLVRERLLGQNVLVFPFLHYYLGGFKISPDCASSIPGLFLAGEITGGLHGRNRLMGNGITDSLVHGRIAGESACAYVK